MYVIPNPPSPMTLPTRYFPDKIVKGLRLLGDGAYVVLSNPHNGHGRSGSSNTAIHPGHKHLGLIVLMLITPPV